MHFFDQQPTQNVFNLFAVVDMPLDYTSLHGMTATQLLRSEQQKASPAENTKLAGLL